MFFFGGKWGKHHFSSVVGDGLFSIQFTKGK